MSYVGLVGLIGVSLVKSAYHCDCNQLHKSEDVGYQEKPSGQQWSLFTHEIGKKCWLRLITKCPISRDRHTEICADYDSKTDA